MSSTMTGSLSSMLPCIASLLLILAGWQMWSVRDPAHGVCREQTNAVTMHLKPMRTGLNEGAPCKHSLAAR